MEAISTTSISTTSTKWWTSFLTPQVVIALVTVIVGAAMFYVTQKNTTKDVEVIKDQMVNKTDVKTTEALEARISRIYDQMNKIDERLDLTEKTAEYQRGFHDGQKEGKTIK